MIDEKELNEWQDELGNDPQGEFTEQSVMTPRDTAELIRLARLGLWAEKHAVPALTQYADPANWEDKHGKGGGTDNAFRPIEDLGGFTHGKFARSALAALPKP